VEPGTNNMKLTLNLPTTTDPLKIFRGYWANK
jgi:hypothetical protein